MKSFATAREPYIIMRAKQRSLKALMFLFIVGILGVPSILRAATNDSYPFSSSTGTYTEISGGTVHGTATNDDTNFNDLLIGFNFTFNGAVYTAFSINANGFIVMGSSASSSYTALSDGFSSSSNNVIAGLNFDLQGTASTGELRSQVLGTAPSRVLVVQWKNYKAYGTSGNGDVFNFQIRLYETSNNIEVHYGSFTKNATNRSAQIGLRGASNADFNNRSVISGTHTWATSVAGTANTATAALTTTFLPASGLIYKWTYAPPPMVFNSATTYQIVNSVKRGTKQTPVIVVGINTGGVANPLAATSFTFNTNGTSDASEVSNARLFYTGSATTFDPNTAIAVGNVIAAPNGTFTISVNQQLVGGANYFWLAYDVADGAKVLHTIDGECTSFTVGGTPRTPSVTAPAGARKIGPIYCLAGANYLGDEYVEEVTFGSLSNRSTDDAGYTEFTPFVNVPQIVRTREYPLSVTVGTAGGNYGGYAYVFIDWNNNEVFEADEQVFAGEFISSFDGGSLPYTFNSTIAVPKNAVEGVTGMRVIVKESGESTVDPCEIYGWGETEDYWINIVSPAQVVIDGNATFGNIGKEVVRTIRIRNASPVENVTVSSWNVTGSSSYKLYLAGTKTSLAPTFTLSANGYMDVDVVFGIQGVSAAGQQNATLSITHNGETSPTVLSLSGNYASLTASDKGKNLLVPGAKFDVGAVQPGSGQISREFSLGSTVALSAVAPLTINSYGLSGTDAGLFQVSTLPSGIVGENLVSVTLRATGAEPGTKRATLTINHSGVNGPVTTIQLEGRIGQPVLGAPTLVTLPPVSAGQTYAGAYNNVALIPLSRVGVVDVQLLKTPTLTGSGAGVMEILSNGGMYFVRGVYNAQGQAVVAGSGNLADAANWVNPVLTPPAVTETQPLLLAVRMKAAAASTPLGSYDATLLLSDGSGNSVSNAVNIVSISVVGEVLNDPNILPFYPAQLAFGSTPIGTTQMRTLAIRNQSGVAGTAQLAITGTDYSFSNGGRSLSVALPATNAPVTVVVQFSPMTAGAANGVITVSGVMTGTVALSGTGQAANAGNLVLLVDGQPLAGTVDFGTVGIGATGSKTVTIINNNIGPVAISSIGRSGVNATQFGVGMLSTTEIAGNGGSATFDVKFMPTSLSNPQKNATITIFNSTGIPKAFNVRGTAAVESGNTVSVTLTPTVYNYGNQGGTHSFTLTNTGNSAITVSGGMVLGSSNFTLADNAATFPRTVAVGASTTLMVQFDASQGVNGLRSASLLVLTAGVTPYPAASLTGMVGSGSIGSFGGVMATTGADVPSVVEIVGSYPNPCVVESELRYRLSASASVEVYVYNVEGRQVFVRHAGIQRAGEQSLRVDATELQSGTYYYVVEANGQRATTTIVVKK